MVVMLYQTFIFYEIYLKKQEQKVTEKEIRQIRSKGFQLAIKIYLMVNK